MHVQIRGCRHNTSPPPLRPSWFGPKVQSTLTPPSPSNRRKKEPGCRGRWAGGGPGTGTAPSARNLRPPQTERRQRAMGEWEDRGGQPPPPKNWRPYLVDPMGPEGGKQAGFQVSWVDQTPTGSPLSRDTRKVFYQPPEPARSSAKSLSPLMLCGSPP